MRQTKQAEPKTHANILNPDMQDKAHLNWRIMRLLLPYLWPQKETGLKVRLILSLLCLVIAKILAVLAPVVYGLAIDTLNGEPVVSDTLPFLFVPFALVVGYGLTRFFSQFFVELREYLFARITQRVRRYIGLRVFSHLLSLSANFHMGRQTGGLSRSIDRGVSAVAVLLRFSVFSILPIFLEILLIGLTLWGLLSGIYAAIIFGTVIVYIIFTTLVTTWRTRFRRTMNAEESEGNTRTVDSLINYETVKYFSAESHEIDRYHQTLLKWETASTRSQLSLMALNLGQAGIIAIGMIWIMGLSIGRIESGHMTVGDFTMVVLYLMQLYQPLNFFGTVYRTMRQSLVDIEEVFGLLDVKQDISNAPDATSLSVTNGHIRFDKVSFAYDERRQVLDGVSFQVPPGKSLAIVGPSGSGKSTLSRLLFRFYDPNSGKISIDGQKLPEVTQESLRKQIGMVPQDTVLFNDTIAYNIGFGRVGACQTEIEDAARLAQVSDFITSLPDGYNSRVGERGLKLSGGEKQRIAIARTILKNPPIFVFDEATSALDSETEAEIQKNLEHLSSGKTTLIIAHRLSTVVNCDEIIVLEAGKIVEQGRHSDLLAKNGLYADMWRRQTEQSETQLNETKTAQSVV